MGSDNPLEEAHPVSGWLRHFYAQIPPHESRFSFLEERCETVAPSLSVEILNFVLLTALNTCEANEDQTISDSTEQLSPTTLESSCSSLRESYRTIGCAVAYDFGRGFL